MATYVKSYIYIVFFIVLHQPFGDGLVTVVMATLRRSENSLYLWNNSSLDQPIHHFIGHNDAVIEFQWRKKEDSEFLSVMFIVKLIFPTTLVTSVIV